jgi:Ser/Thr protein kinase RdoA (MazF antagonist)
MQDALIEGYQRVRALSNDHLKSIETFVFMQRLGRIQEILFDLRDHSLAAIAAHPKWKIVQNMTRKLAEASKANGESTP